MQREIIPGEPPSFENLDLVEPTLDDGVFEEGAVPLYSSRLLDLFATSPESLVRKSGSTPNQE